MYDYIEFKLFVLVSILLRCPDGARKQINVATECSLAVSLSLLYLESDTPV